VKNFDQLMVGDAVQIQFARALALDLKKGSTAEISRTVESGTATAEPGAKPGAAGGLRVHIVAEVTAVDAATQTITLRGPERTLDLKINDPEQFKKHCRRGSYRGDLRRSHRGSSESNQSRRMMRS
jgi:hypothetical protein